MKKLMIAVATGLTVSVASNAFAADITLKLAHFAAETHPGHKAALQNTNQRV